jgi:hypothetical protein
MATTTHPHLVLPNDPSYDQRRLPWNVAVDQRPAVVALPTDAAEVRAAVRHARERGLRIAVQGTGHGAAILPDLDGTMLIRTSGIGGVRIDPATRTARIGAGALWQDVVPAAAEHGLVGLAGSAPDVGIVGYSLGGGMGYLARRFGLQANHVTAVELVTAEGEHVRADASHEPELFWALRGGGGGFGVVTAMEFALEPLDSVYAGGMYWPIEAANRVLGAWRDLTLEAPDALTSMGRLMHFPPLPQIPEPLRGRAWVNVQAAFIGSEAEGAELLRPLRELRPAMDSFSVIGPNELLRLHGDPEGPTPGLIGGALTDALPDEAIDAFVAAVGPRSPLVVSELRHLGGALGRAEENAGALATVDGAYALHTVGIPVGGPQAELTVQLATDAVIDALRPFGSGRQYTNFAGGPVTGREVFGEETAARVAAARMAADPAGVFEIGHRFR